MKMRKASKLIQLMKYGFPRAVGHTWCEVHGIKNNPKAILIVLNERDKRCIDLPREQMLCVSEIPEALIGRRVPIIIDHAALRFLVDEHNSRGKNRR